MLPSCKLILLLLDVCKSVPLGPPTNQESVLDLSTRKKEDTNNNNIKTEEVLATSNSTTSGSSSLLLRNRKYSELSEASNTSESHTAAAAATVPQPPTDKEATTEPTATETKEGDQPSLKRSNPSSDDGPDPKKPSHWFDLFMKILFLLCSYYIKQLFLINLC